MRTAEEVAREVDYATKDWDPGNGASEEDLARWADIIRARDAEVRAEALAEFTEWFAPAVTYDNGNTVPTGSETVLREFAQADVFTDHPDARVARRLVGPWEPVSDDRP